MKAWGVDGKHPRAWVHPHRFTPERISEQADRFRPIRTTGNGNNEDDDGKRKEARTKEIDGQKPRARRVAAIDRRW